MADFSLLIVGTFVLGLRHGVDWDHIAAISDIVGASSTDSKQSKLKSLFLTTCYSVGHGLVVVALGIAAICFGAILPSWIDGVMERVVGLTLVFLGLWVLYSLVRHLVDGKQFEPKSRIQLVLSAVNSFVKRSNKFNTDIEAGEKKTRLPYDSATTFGIGTIHGIGAETGSQVLLLVSAGDAGSSLGIPMLFAFVTGLVVSNTILAISLMVGFRSAKIRTPALAIMSALAGTFSIAVGSVFLFGQDAALPDLQKIVPQ